MSVRVVGAGVLLALLCASASADPGLSRRLAVLRALEPREAALSRPRPPAPRCSAEAGRRRAAEDRVARAVRDASIRFGVDSALIRSVIRVESRGDAGAVSHAGARGLMQLMPGTARDLGVHCSFDPRQNVMGGTRYLRQLRDALGSWRDAIAAYHAGPRRVREGRIPATTRRYVELVWRGWRGRR